MARLKFLLFALVALGLWAYHLLLISPLVVTGSVEQAQAAISGAAGPVAVALESQRSLTQAVALKVATSNASWNAGPKAGAKPEAPTVDRFAMIRTAAGELVPADQKAALFVAITNEVGVLWARGEGEPTATVPEGLDLANVMQAGTAGAVQVVDGVNYLLLPAPLLISDKNEVRVGGSVIIGLPLVPQIAALAQAQKALGLDALALVSDGKPVLLAGDKAIAEDALKRLKSGTMGPLVEGPVRDLGPLQLPLMTDSLVQVMGGRQAIGGTSFEVVAIASSKAALEALSTYQVFGLGGLAGLVLLSLVFLIIMGGTEERGASMVVPPMPVPPSITKREEPLPPAPLTMAEPQPAPEASPDDFDFPPSNPIQPAMAPPPPPPPAGITGQAPVFEPESDPFATAAPPSAPRPPPPVATTEAPALQRSAPGLMDEEEGQRTVAYPAFKPPMGSTSAPMAPPPPIADPFALAAAQEPSPGAPSPEDNPDATRVAAIPAELIKAARSASGVTGERPALKPPTASMPRVASIAPAAAGNDEERHFQEVFRDFVATREKCREPADGLTFEKFKAKLLKNKEQLVAKYQCKTVRFQVYVKDGKAALKATPVKD
ncbi:MAG: MXAN_5187 family protein [Archangium sp.]